MSTNHNGPDIGPAAELDHLPSESPTSLVPLADAVAPPKMAAEGDPNKPPYEVGYKRPPKHTRFKPGQSGNPKGRRPKLLNVKKEIEFEFLRKVPVRVGSKTVYVTKIALLVSQLTAKGIKGDTRAAMEAFKIADRFGVLKARDQHRFLESIYTDLTPEETQIRDQWYQITDKYRIFERYVDNARKFGIDLDE